MIWVGRLILIAVILQTIEYYWTPFYPTRRWIQKCDRFVLALRMVAAIFAFFDPTQVEVALMLLTTWVIAMRWRGTFNGGSDIMTFHILGAWLVSLCFPGLERACTYSIAIQIVLSNLIAGASKSAKRDWRDGTALHVLMQRYGYQLGPASARALSWVTLLFEVSFPLAVIAPLPFLIAGMLFHLVNAYAMGLNRFFFVWLAGYPALLALSLTR